MVKFKTPTVELPEDISTLQAMILQLLSDVNEKNRQIDDCFPSAEVAQDDTLGKFKW